MAWVQPRKLQLVPLVARVPSSQLVVDHGGLLAVLCDCCCKVIRVVFLYNTLGTLVVIWVHPTRLETRTKESNMCMSLWVRETPRCNEGSLVPPR